MSDLRFVRELGAEFERVERARAAKSQRRGSRSLGGAIGPIVTAVTIVIPVVIVVLAIGMFSHSRNGGQHVPAHPPGASAAVWSQRRQLPHPGAARSSEAGAEQSSDLTA